MIKNYSTTLKTTKSRSLVLFLLLFATIPGFCQITIGSGTSTQRFPFNYWYGYSRTATIYSAVEMNTTSTGSTITTISWYSTVASAITGPTIIYLKQVGTTTAVASDTWANTIAGATTVYTGTPTSWTVGWNTIDITDYPIAANQNLEILVECNSGGGGIGTSTSTAFQYTTGPASSNAHWQQDNTAPTGTPAASSSGAINAFRPNVILGGLTPPPPPLCTTNISPVNSTTGVVTPATLSWNAAPGATSYTVYLGTSNPPIDSFTSVTTTSTTIFGGAPSTTYYWYVIPKNGGGSAVGCSSNVTSFTTAAGPANDACANAVNLTVSNGFCATPVLGSISLADSTAGLGGASCTTVALKFDVWYKVTVPASGKVTVQTSAVNTTVTDLVMQAYSGTCGSLTSIGCNDDGNPDPGTSASHPKLGLTGRTPGEVIYFRVMPYSTAINIGAFAICAFDTSATTQPAIALGTANTCNSAVTATADSAWKYTWIPIKDASGAIIAEVYPNGNNLGAITASYYRNTGAVRSAGPFYLDRNFTITPANQPGASRPSVRLYLTNAELTAFAAVAGATTRAQLMLTKNNAPCSGVFLQNGNVGLGVLNGSGAYGSDHYVEDSVSSFSSFFLHRTGTILPISLTYLKGLKAGTGNALTWKVNCTSVSITMELERSADSRTFKSITSITATQARCNQPFDYTDAAPLKGTNYYRLKMIDVDGKVTYSPIVAIINGTTGAELVGIYPTVVRGEAFLSVAASRSTKMQINISDMSGRVIKTISQTVANGSTLVNISTANLSAGVYNITGMLDGMQTKTLRFVKQ